MYDWCLNNAVYFKDNNTLERLNLSSNWLEGEGGQALARTLEENDFISELVSTRKNTYGAINPCLLSECIDLYVIEAQLIHVY